MKNNNVKFGVMEVLSLAGIYILAATFFNSEYLFNWIAHNRTFYFLLCGIPLMLLLFNKKLVSASITIGITGGVFIGNYLGRWINNYNEGRITAGMSAEEVARLQHHPGFEIWMGVIFIALVIGVIIQRVIARKYA